MRAGFHLLRFKLTVWIGIALVCYLVVIAVANEIGVRGNDKTDKAASAPPAPKIVYVTPQATPTAAPNLERDHWKPQNDGGTPLGLIILIGVGGAIVGCGSLMAIGGLTERREKRAEFTAWKQQQTKPKAPATAPRPMMGSGGKTVVADRPVKPADPSTNGHHQ